MISREVPFTVQGIIGEEPIKSGRDAKRLVMIKGVAKPGDQLVRLSSEILVITDYGHWKSPYVRGTRRIWLDSVELQDEVDEDEERHREFIKLFETA